MYKNLAHVCRSCSPSDRESTRCGLMLDRRLDVLFNMSVMMPVRPCFGIAGKLVYRLRRRHLYSASAIVVLPVRGGRSYRMQCTDSLDGVTGFWKMACPEIAAALRRVRCSNWDRKIRPAQMATMAGRTYGDLAKGFNMVDALHAAFGSTSVEGLSSRRRPCLAFLNAFVLLYGIQNNCGCDILARGIHAGTFRASLTNCFSAHAMHARVHPPTAVASMINLFEALT